MIFVAQCWISERTTHVNDIPHFVVRLVFMKNEEQCMLSGYHIQYLTMIAVI